MMEGLRPLCHSLPVKSLDSDTPGPILTTTTYPKSIKKMMLPILFKSLCGALFDDDASGLDLISFTLHYTLYYCLIHVLY